MLEYDNTSIFTLIFNEDFSQIPTGLISLKYNKTVMFQGTLMQINAKHFNNSQSFYICTGEMNSELSRCEWKKVIIYMLMLKRVKKDIDFQHVGTIILSLFGLPRLPCYCSVVYSTPPHDSSPRLAL